MKDIDIDAFILVQKAQVTKYKDNSDLNTFSRFFVLIKETSHIENKPAVQLHKIRRQILYKCKNKESIPPL